MQDKSMLQQILKARKIKLERASELTGINIDTIRALVYKQDNYLEIKVDTLIKLCIGLNIKATDLFEDEITIERVKRLSRKSRRKVK